MPKILPWDDREYSLCENKNDGTLRFLKPGSLMGPWRVVPKAEKIELLTREHKRQNFYNEFLGWQAGKTIVIMGAGPMMARMDGRLAQHLAEREDISVWCVNAMPKYAKLVWGIDPNRLYDAIIGADAVHENIWSEWGWDYARDVAKFCKRRSYSYNWIPVKSTSYPVLSAQSLFYRDSVTAALNLALLALATDTRIKHCAGPRCEWPERRLVRAEGGRIVLVGVEANRRDHCYTANPDFVLEDNPDCPWEGMENKMKAHEMLRGFSVDVGAEILQAAPWSTVDMYKPCDFEEALGIPEELRCGVTAKGMPEEIERVFSNEVCGKYQDDRIKWHEGGRKDKEPERPRPDPYPEVLLYDPPTLPGWSEEGE